MSNQRLVFLEKAWEIVEQEPSVWDAIEVKDKSFYYKTDQKKIFLSSFKSRNLPSSPYSLTILGKLLTKLSTLANIMSRRPGTEEVTFYVLHNSPQRGIFGNKADKKNVESCGSFSCLETPTNQRKNSRKSKRLHGKK